jgi:hypothetical protein
MSDNIEYTLQATYGAEFFDFAAASGEYEEPVPSSVAQTCATPNSPWNEGWDDFSMGNINHGAPLESSMQTSGGFATDNSYFAGTEAALHHHQPASNTPTAYDLPHEPNIWDSGSSISQIDTFPFGGSTSTEPHNNIRPNPFVHTALDSFNGHTDDQPIQGSSRMDRALPLEGDQFE